jgi:chromate transporter
MNPEFPSFREAFRVWLKVAIYSFGGPAGQIAVMHKLIVVEKKWLGENRFLHALNYCMLLPGPEAQQLITYIGWLMYRTKGGIVAGALFVLPGFLAILVLSILYALWKDVTFVQGILYGIKPAVLAIVVGAVIKIGKRALKNEVMVGLSVLAFVAIFCFKISFPFIILAAGLIGFLGGKIWEKKFLVIKGHADVKDGEEGLIDSLLKPIKPTAMGTLTTVAFWLVLWLLPVVVLALTLGMDHIFTKEGLFFSQSAGRMLCWLLSPSKQLRFMAGCSPAKCSTGWAWPKPRRGHLFRWCNSWASWVRSAMRGRSTPSGRAF